MTTLTKTVTQAMIAHLAETAPDEDISVVDARRRASIDLPTLAVSTADSEPFNETLHMVKRMEMEVILRVHTGDHEADDINSWCDQIESALNDVSVILSWLNAEGLRAYDYTYVGSEQDWDENILETTFSAELVCAAI